MDMEDIHYLLGGTIFARAENYMKHIESFDCETEENGVRHLCAEIEGSGDHLYTTEAWLRQNGSFVSASCTCPYNDNGNGLFCEHIGALLLYDLKEQKAVKVQRRTQTEPAKIPGVVRGVANLPEKPAEEPEAPRKDSYVSGLEMLFGKNGGATSRSPTTQPVHCCAPIRKGHWLSWRTTPCPSAPVLWNWNRN